MCHPISNKHQLYITMAEPALWICVCLCLIYSEHKKLTCTHSYMRQERNRRKKIKKPNLKNCHGIHAAVLEALSTSNCFLFHG